MKVSLFVTCLGDLFYVRASQATVELLEHLGCEVSFHHAQTCCGQPAYNSGYHKQAKDVAKHIIKTFQKDEYVVTPSGSCAYMLHTYPSLFSSDDEWREMAEELKQKTYELTQFITDVLNITDVGASFQATATYHTSCHMTRLLGVQHSPFTLLSNVKGLQLIPLQNEGVCCGFGGTFAVSMSNISGDMVEEKVNCIESINAEYVIGADAGCLLNISGRIGYKKLAVKSIHIAEVSNNGR